MAVNETSVTAPLYMDRDTPLGNSEGNDGRRALHVKIKNNPNEPTSPSTYSTGTNTRPSVTSTSSIISASDPLKKFTRVFNGSGAVIYIKEGATAVVNEGVRVANNEKFETQFTGDIHAIRGAGSGAVEVFVGK